MLYFPCFIPRSFIRTSHQTRLESSMLKTKFTSLQEPNLDWDHVPWSEEASAFILALFSQSETVLGNPYLSYWRNISVSIQISPKGQSALLGCLRYEKQHWRMESSIFSQGTLVPVHLNRHTWEQNSQTQIKIFCGKAAVGESNLQRDLETHIILTQIKSVWWAKLSVFFPYNISA